MLHLCFFSLLSVKYNTPIKLINLTLPPDYCYLSNIIVLLFSYSRLKTKGKDFIPQLIKRGQFLCGLCQVYVVAGLRLLSAVVVHVDIGVTLT